MAYEIRSLANFVLDRADQIERQVSNVHMNKILYFLYVWYLLKKKDRLSNAKIEAWDYGPVFREIWLSFKSYGSGNITGRARALDLETGEYKVCEYIIEEDDRAFLIPLIDQYLSFRPFDLVELTHRSGTPWDKVYNHGGRSNPGMCVSDELIKRYYARQTRQ